MTAVTVPGATAEAVAGQDDRPLRRSGRPRDERVSRAILESARRQLAELGYAQMSMESIATAAGVSRATIYRRHRDKADLVTAAIADGIPTPPPEPPADPRAAIITYLERLQDRLGGECFEVLTSIIAEREDTRALKLHRERILTPRFAYLARLLETARERGELAEEADLELAAEMLVGSVFSRRIGGRHATPGWAERAVTCIFAGMAADPS